MTMLYSDSVQADVIRFKSRAALAAVVESMTDNDEALDRREIEPLDYQDGFTVSMPAPLGYYHSTGTGTPMLDALAQRVLDSQAAEWARTYPDRASLPDCATGEGEFATEAQEWEDAAFHDETIYARCEVVNDHGQIVFRACFTDEINAPHGTEYSETLDQADFLALEGTDLEALVSRVAEAPYLSLVTVQNSGGRWHAWFGTADGRVAHYAVGGAASEAEARSTVERNAA